MTRDRFDLFVPGRLCLFGEHSDWAGGYRTQDGSIEPGHCLVVGTTQGIHATVEAHQYKLIVNSTTVDGTQIDSCELGMYKRELQIVARDGGFFSYCAGVAYYMLKDLLVGGLIATVKTDLPIRKGLSSSAAICVLIARAFSRIYDLGLTIEQEMDYAYRGEILTPSECGRMDQVCAYNGVPVFLTFDGNNMKVKPLRLGRPIYMVVVDLNKEKNTKKILSDLNKCFMGEGSTTRKYLRYALGEANTGIVTLAKKALIRGDSETLGRLMCRAQKVFDEFVLPASITELASPKLHWLLSLSEIQGFVWGGKGVGSQGDGSAQFVTKGPEAQRELIQLLSEMDVCPYELTIGADES